MVALNRKFFQLVLDIIPLIFPPQKYHHFAHKIFRHFQNMFRLNQKYDEWGII